MVRIYVQTTFLLYIFILISFFLRIRISSVSFLSLFYSLLVCFFHFVLFLIARCSDSCFLEQWPIILVKEGSGILSTKAWAPHCLKFKWL
jgi:hypothetical protein